MCRRGPIPWKCNPSAARGTYSLTATSTPATSPFQPIPAGTRPDGHRRGRLHRRRPPRPGRRQRRTTTRCRCCWAMATAPSRPRSPTRSGRTRSRSWRGTSTATATSTWPSPTRWRRHGVGVAGQWRRHLPAPGHLRGRVGPGRDRGGGFHRRRPPRPGRRQRGDSGRCRCCWAMATAPSRPRSPTRSGSDPDAIVAGDFNGDGHLDLAVANYDGDGHGVGVAGQWRRHLPAPGHLRGRVGPVRDRGRGLQRRRPPRPRHRQLRQTSTVSVLLGNGDGTFQPQVTYAVGASPIAIVAGDFTATATSTWPSPTAIDSTVSVLLGNGDGTFAPQVTYAVGADPDAIVAGDFTGDGHLDLAVANYGDDTVSVLLGNGDGTFQPLSQPSNAVGSHPDAIVAGDFNGDGHLDLAVANCGDNTVSVLLGNGDGTFQPQVTYAVGSDPDAIVAGDFNGDGRLDLAVANVRRRHGVGVAGQWRRHLPAPGHLRGRGRTRTRSWRGTSTATATSTWPSPTPAVPDGTVSVLLGNGDGTFAPQVTYAVGSVPGRRSWRGLQRRRPPRPGRRQRARLGDGTVSVLLGNGDGTFAPRSPTRSGIGPGRDRGGGLHRRRPPRPGRRQRRRRARCRCCWAMATAPSRPRSPTRSGRARTAIVAGDFTGDGHLDLAVAN